jgi:hypothetical protein
MAEQGVLRDARIWMGAYEITASINAVRLAHGCEVRDPTVLGNNTRREAAGMRLVSARVAGLYAVDGTDEIDDILSDNLATANTPISIGPQTGALGEVGYTFQSLQAIYNWGGIVGDLPGYEMNASGRGTPLVRGTIMHSGAETASGDETGYQVGEVLAGETMYAALHVPAVSGTNPTLDLIIESDDNGGFTSAVTRMTFTQATDITSEWLIVAGPITDDYWRASWVIGGTDTPTFTFAVVMGIF